MAESGKTDHLRTFIWLIGIVSVLYVCQKLFIPFFFAVFIAFILYPICKWLESRKIPRSIAISISIFLLIIPILGIAVLLFNQLVNFHEQLPELRQKVPEVVNRFSGNISNITNTDPQQLKVWLKDSFSKSVDLSKVVQETITVSAFSLVLFLLIPVYVFLILYYRIKFFEALRLFVSELSSDELKTLFSEIATTYYRFVTGMAIVYLAVGILNSIGFYLLGIPNPIFLGLVASILTMVPYLGIMIGGLVPFTMALITHDSAWYAVGVIGVLSLVQILEANLIFPLAVGKRLELNPLIVLLGIIAGGILWGVAGMILLIPIIGIFNIIASRLPGLQKISKVISIK